MNIYLKLTVSEETANKLIETMKEIYNKDFTLPPDGEVINIDIDGAIKKTGIPVDVLFSLVKTIVTEQIKGTPIIPEDAWFIKRTDCQPAQYLKPHKEAGYCFRFQQVGAAIFTEVNALTVIAALKEEYQNYTIEKINVIEDLGK